jgi:hypothetical protein
MGKGAITLADLDGKLVVMELRCEHCDRFGRYQTASLIERFGRNESVLNIGAELATGCPKRKHFDVHDLCRARWSDDVLVARYGPQRARELAEWSKRSKARMR